MEKETQHIEFKPNFNEYVIDMFNAVNHNKYDEMLRYIITEIKSTRLVLAGSFNSTMFWIPQVFHPVTCGARYYIEMTHENSLSRDVLLRHEK